MHHLPEVIETEDQLEELLSRPTPGAVQAMKELEGDLVILGSGGKIGPTLAQLARRAAKEAGKPARIIGVDKQFSPESKRRLEAAGVETVVCDLLDRDAVAKLPEAPNVIFMAGMKFGSTGNESLTWAMNAYLPALCAERYRKSRIVVFSSGNIYHLVPIVRGGSREVDQTAPFGEYAQSVLARERMFEYFSRTYGTRVVLFRLNYAVELRYGILLDIAQKVWTGTAIDVTMGNANVIWQGDVNSQVIQCIALAQSPPYIVNIAGPEIISVRTVALRFGELLGREPRFTGEEAPTALLSNASQAHHRFGYPSVPLETIIRYVAHWIKLGGPTLNKPTHYEQRDGKF